MFSRQIAAARLRWILPSLFFLGVLVLAHGVPMQAAPHNQTVPEPTATPAPPEPPPATPTPRPDDDDDDDDDDDGGDSGDGGTSAPEPTPTTEELGGTVNVAGLNVRSGPGTDFAVIGQLVSGDRVIVRGQNADGSWWAICCTPTGEEGWVAARFVNPEFDPALAPLPVLAADDAAVDPESAAPATDTSAASSAATSDSAPPSSLVLTMQHIPEFAWQDETFAMQATITNPGDGAARNVELRNEIAPGLIFVSATGGDDAAVNPPAAEGGAVLSIGWPTLEAGASISATVTLRIAADLSDGAVIDNVAAVSADNAASASAGVTIGLPPPGLPDFK